jgi:hypothetical protein
MSYVPQGLVPDFILRPVIRMLCRQRLREINHGSFEANHAAKMKWIEDVRTRETIADTPEKANEQHYEVSLSSISFRKNLIEWRRSPRILFCHVWVLTQNIHHVCTQPAKKLSKKPKSSCSIAIAKKPN